MYLPHLKGQLLGLCRGKFVTWGLFTLLYYAFEPLL